MRGTIIELHSVDTARIRRACRERFISLYGRTACRSRRDEGNCGRRDIGMRHGDRNPIGGRRVVRITRHRRESMRAVAHGTRIPADTVGRTRIFGTEIRSIQFKLHAKHANVIRGVGRDGDGSKHRCAIRRRGHGNCGRYQIIVHRERPCSRRLHIERRVARPGRERM